MPRPQTESSVAKNVTNRFYYLKWDDIFHRERPFQVLIDIPPDAHDQRKQNIDFQLGDDEVVVDVRGLPVMPTLDAAAFTYIRVPTTLAPQNFSNKQMIEIQYLPECEALLKENLDGVDEMVIYDWRVRHTQVPKRQGSVVDLNDPLSPIGAATHVHVDQSPKSVVQRIQMMFPDRETELLQGRVRLINLWRPINGPVQNWPLAICDGRTLSESNLVETERVRRTFTGNTMFLLKGTGVKWYYMSEQRDDEVLMFKSFDSQQGVAHYAAHGSFPLFEDETLAPPRESIEVRALVFTLPHSE